MDNLDALETLADALTAKMEYIEKRMILVEEVIRAAAAIRAKLSGHLQAPIATAWLDPELKRLDSAFRALEKKENS